LRRTGGRSNEKSGDFYFSGTGNSLAAARDIASKMNGVLTAIPSLNDRESITTDADVIGIVFPVYFAANDNGGIPLMVRRFVGRLDDIGSKYVFAVCTHGGMPGTTIENFGRAVGSRGGRLAAGFAVKMSAPPSPAEKIRQYLSHEELAKTDPGLAGKDSVSCQKNGNEAGTNLRIRRRRKRRLLRDPWPGA
jgi:flavodoxin